MHDSVPGSHRRAVAARRLALAPRGAPELDAERAMFGMDTWDPPPAELPEIDWERLVHKGALDKEVALEQVVHQNRTSFVARARRRRDQRDVALKILSPALWEDGVFEERFRREGDILATLEHPNLVRLVDRGTYGYARWLMLEWVHGPDLRTALARGPLGVDLAIERVLDLCAGLDALHQRGLVHRDIKPENLLWDESAKKLVLTDFGIAKLRDGRAGELTLTFTEDVIGTRGYMAPECAHGWKYADHRMDVYAAGIVLLELATGQRGPKELGEKLDLPAVDARIDGILARSTAYDPDARYPSAKAMREDLARVRRDGWIRRVFGRR